MYVPLKQSLVPSLVLPSCRTCSFYCQPYPCHIPVYTVNGTYFRCGTRYYNLCHWLAISINNFHDHNVTQVLYSSTQIRVFSPLKVWEYDGIIEVFYFASAPSAIRFRLEAGEQSGNQVQSTYLHTSASS